LANKCGTLCSVQANVSCSNLTTYELSLYAFSPKYIHGARLGKVEKSRNHDMHAKGGKQKAC
jgi:hypothetical protein